MSGLGIDPLYLFVFLGLFSPGPNIILLTASGARFGLRRTLPHILGVALGVGVIAAMAGIGVAALLLAEPGIANALRALAFLWILWMAWRLFQTSRAGDVDEQGRPFTLVEAILFQWVNPKVWAVALAASAGYAGGLTPTGEAARLALAFSGINLFVCLFWTYAGTLLSYLLSHPRAWRIFMGAMAVFLALSGLTVFL